MFPLVMNPGLIIGPLWAYTKVERVGMHSKRYHYAFLWSTSICDFHISGINYSYSQFHTYLTELLEKLKINFCIVSDRESTQCSIAFTIKKRGREILSLNISLYFIHHSYLSNEKSDLEMYLQYVFFFIIRHMVVLLLI